MEKQTNKQNKKMITWPPSHWMKPARIQGVMYICFRYGSINMKWQIESDVHLSDLFVAEDIHVMYSSLLNLQLSTVFPRTIAGGKYFLFRTKRGRLFEEGDCLREALFSNIAHWKSCPKYFVLFSPLNQKLITSNKINMGFLSVPTLVPWLIFIAWIEGLNRH